MLQSVKNQIKPFIFKAIDLLHGGKGIPVNIGGLAKCRMAANFYFAGWEKFGTGHNSGFRHCLEDCSKSRIFFDVGGHIGLYSLPAAKKMQMHGGQVYAFEPGTINYSMLEKHRQLNQLTNLKIYPYLVGDKEEREVSFFEDLSGVNPMNTIAEGKKRSNSVRRVKKQISLDEFCFKNNIFPDLIKIDVEGAEIYVLEGAKRLLKEKRPKIYLSLHPPFIAAMGRNMKEILPLLQEMGYSISDCEGNDNSDFHDKEAILNASV